MRLRKKIIALATVILALLIFIKIEPLYRHNIAPSPNNNFVQQSPNHTPYKLVDWKITGLKFEDKITFFVKPTAISLNLHDDEDNVSEGIVSGTMKGECNGAIYGSYSKGEIMARGGGNCFIEGKTMLMDSDIKGILRSGDSNSMVIELTFQGYAGDRQLNKTLNLK